MKYIVARKSKFTGRVEYKMTKCTESWCSPEYYNNHPERIWKFTKQGAIGIVNRGNKYDSWANTYFILTEEGEQAQ